MQPVHIFAPTGYAASSSIDPDNHNTGALVHTLASDLGPVGEFTPGDNDSFAELYPDWATWVAGLRKARSHSLWLDPASGYYVFARNDLVNTSGTLPGSTPPPPDPGDAGTGGRSSRSRAKARSAGESEDKPKGKH